MKIYGSPRRRFTSAPRKPEPGRVCVLEKGERERERLLLISYRPTTQVWRERASCVSCVCVYTLTLCDPTLAYVTLFVLSGGNHIISDYSKSYFKYTNLKIQMRWKWFYFLFFLLLLLFTLHMIFNMPGIGKHVIPDIVFTFINESLMSKPEVTMAIKNETPGAFWRQTFMSYVDVNILTEIFLSYATYIFKYN